ncbi:MAG: FAD-dependent oxidoreductase [Lachnospiraceae bacterium]|nr:FAD-dependent oxidoreductase [Lachnospiraceae bacterium]MDY5741686.1 FAD-dependent oxidoreductase [Lachnospiraceae bacterium]
MSKIVVIGANHAGTAALNTILDNYQGHEVTAFDANSNISFLGCGMALWIGNQISGSDGLFYSNKETLEGKGAKVYMETPVRRVDYSAKKVYAVTKDGQEIVQDYDKLILATGSLPILPKFEGHDLENIQQVKLFQDAAAVIKKLEDPSIRRVAVIGAGYIGVELAEAFQRNGREIVLIDVAETCLSNYYDNDFTTLMEKNLADHGVQIAFGEKVEKFLGENGKVSAVVTDKNSYPIDMAVVCIGFCPNTAVADGQIELFKNSAFLVDKTQQTSLPDVYAIGDCATVYDNSKGGERSYIALATNAVRSGIIAAHNACGTHLETIGVQGSNGISIYGLNMVSTGMSEATAKANGYDVLSTTFDDWQKAEFIESGNDRVKIKIVYDRNSRVVLGAQIASTHDISLGIHMFSLAIQEQVTIDRLKLLDIFFLPHFNKPYNYFTMAALSAK